MRDENAIKNGNVISPTPWCARIIREDIMPPKINTSNAFFLIPMVKKYKANGIMEIAMSSPNAPRTYILRNWYGAKPKRNAPSIAFIREVNDERKRNMPIGAIRKAMPRRSLKIVSYDMPNNERIAAIYPDKG